MFTAFIVLICALLVKVPQTLLINYLGNDISNQIRDNLVYFKYFHFVNSKNI